MYRPPADDRTPPAIREPSWSEVLQSYALPLLVLLSLWAIENPLTATVGLVAIVTLLPVARRAVWAIRCLRDCGAFTIELGSQIEICVARPTTRCPSA